ncbi:exosortase-associated EpsI family protein [Planctomycetota bacterium]
MKSYDKRRISLLRNYCLAAVVLILAGFVYRVAAIRLEVMADGVNELPVSLSNFPMKINGWVGQEVSIPEYIERVAGNSDYFYRLYIDSDKKRWAGVYVAYSSSPRTMLGHRPEVCYVAGGWVHQSSSQSQLVSIGDKVVPYTIHRFVKPTGGYEEIVVLNFYILNGHLTLNERGFSGLRLRRPNISGRAANYVTQVQVSSVLENSVHKAAEDMTDLILEFFPDINGRVESAKLLKAQSR